MRHKTCFVCSGWQESPGTSTIERVRLTELDFPAVTVCPDWATDQLAIQTVFNMIDFHDPGVKEKLKLTLEDMRRVFYQPDSDRSDIPGEQRRLGWILDFSPDSVTNLKLRKEDMMNYALNHEGNLYNAMFYKVECIHQTSII